MTITQTLIDEIKRQALKCHRLELEIDGLKGDVLAAERQVEHWQQQAKASKQNAESERQYSSMVLKAIDRIAAKREAGSALRAEISSTYRDMNRDLPPAEAHVPPCFVGAAE